MNQSNYYNIKNTKPNLDCKYCEIHNFLNTDDTKSNEKYAICKNNKKTFGCYSIDIVYKANPLLFETSCNNCKYCESKKQLTLF